ncbi:MAG: ATP synthase F1 subunit epsilon [Defluviitaleaceae bacterium]|nr:ATP synthase F1 subunit epsilon [Defluviitaleaceae bacterium]
MASINLTVRSPEKEFFSGEISEVIFTTPEGSVGVMYGHSPMVASVEPGVMEIKINDEWKIAAVGPGFAEIIYDTADFFLDSAEWADEIDLVRARDALERAEHRLKSGLSRMEHMRSQAAMSRALARLKAVQNISGR